NAGTKRKSKTKAKPQARQNPQDELPEWYHPGLGEVNCGKCGSERSGHPPAELDYFGTVGGFMNRGVKHTLWGILGVWVILMIAFSPKLIEAHREVTDAQQLFTGYATSLLNHRYEEAYSFCGSEFRNAMPYDRFAKLQMDL